LCAAAFSANYRVFLTFWIIPARPHCAPTALVVTPDLGADVHCTRVRPRPWRADAQYEGRWASWVLVLSRAAFVLVASNPVGDLVHAGFELLKR
jgi:hypothetical protein